MLQFLLSVIPAPACLARPAGEAGRRESRLLKDWIPGQARDDKIFIDMLNLFRVFLLIIFIILLSYFVYLLFPTSVNPEEIRFVVNLDEPQENIVARLKNENFIRSPKLFSFLASLMRFPDSASWRIEPGAYLLSKRMTLIRTLNTLLYHPYQKWVTVVPGNRLEQVIEKMVKIFSWNESQAGEFKKEAREGYLFPDTYLIPVEETPAQVAKRLENNFQEHFDKNMYDDLLAQDVRVDTAVKIASLIERESGGDEDKALIAGIIWNRLNKGMKLQIDATAQYYTGTPGNWWPKVRPEDLKVDHPYNTYIIKGLPPAPIANPSLASLKAAVYPAQTDCFYYLHDRNKQIHCAESFEEHKENIEVYLR